ncbi:cell division protein ZapC [Shewanella intestini]|uniref:Cell division protein ZapC n=1 Tax=Shewanella intestini TaxID=2017544 RepID=A0ABS5I1G3_9GAMM|nr:MULTISPECIES: cell division protein ZapC [Shewanella]MBR9727862.1 cell division protein ZapC [Shewanella intestini]MRG36145.1 cell division protein ZapC [Shewanella sp. XMDDZSB0408]
MLIMPNTDWQWEFNEEHKQLSISLGSDMAFLTPYKSKLLIPDALASSEFTVEHAKYYISLLEWLPNALRMSDAAIVQTALNATAANFLLKPQMPKSWFFETSSECVYSEVGKLFNLICNGQRVLVLVVENSLQASTVLLLSQSCQLNGTKQLVQFDTIKVMHDRLQPLKRQLSKQVVAA